jgi:hypothetical protein
MEEITEPIKQIPSEVPLKQCLDCAEDIKPSANVCRYCRKAQGGLLRFLEYYQVIALSVSIGLLLVAVLNFLSIRDQLSQAREANVKAETASKAVEEMERRIAGVLSDVLRVEQGVISARSEVFDVGRAVMELSEIIPRAGGYGGFGTMDLERIKKLHEYLRSKVNK